MPIPQRIAAVPNRIEQDFGSAPPGHKFLIYFKGWQAGNYRPWKDAKSDSHDKDTKKREDVEISRQRAEVLREVCPLSDGVVVVEKLRERQKVLAAGYPEVLSIPAASTAPFATGLGNEHPIENGFSFLTPYGLPYLPGSGVKGVLRRAAEEMSLFPEEYAIAAEAAPALLDVWWLFGFEGAAGAWWSLTRKEERELSDDKKARRARFKHRFDTHLKTLINRSDLPDFTKLAYPKPKEHTPLLADPEKFLSELDGRRQNIHTRGVLDFWDVFPQTPRQGPYRDKLTVEIMTPHYSKYYQGEQSPHDAGQPNPISFLAVPAGSAFDFHVVCHSAYLPETLGERWRPMLGAIFAHAFDWLGFGAKTAVGYGAMVAHMPDAADEGNLSVTSGAQATAAPELVSPSQATVTPPAPTVEQWPHAQLGWNKGKGELTALYENKKSFSPSGQGRAVFERLSEEIRKRLDKGKTVPVNVTVEAAGRNWVIVSLEGLSA